MRRPRRAAAAYLTAIITALALGLAFDGQMAVGAGLAPGFPASRVKLDPPSQTLSITGGNATLTASVVNFAGTPLANVPVKLTVLYGPDTKAAPATKSTDKNGKATFTLANAGGPGTDVVQATFVGATELHKSNRPTISWISGPPPAAIESPATITVGPVCYQPASAAAVTSDVISPAPVVAASPRPPAQTPPPATRTSSPGLPTPQPVPFTYTIAVDGANFNPFSAVLITFDAGPGGHPESFQVPTDGFGHFTTNITPTERPEGLYLVRADDFRQREAQATFTIPCFQPSLALDPDIGPPGFVPFAVGTGFPPNSPVVTLIWRPGIPSPLPKQLKTDASGSFRVPVLVMYHDILGPRQLVAIVPNPNGPNAGAAIEADAPFLVTLGREQPGFVYRR